MSPPLLGSLRYDAGGQDRRARFGIDNVNIVDKQTFCRHNLPIEGKGMHKRTTTGSRSSYHHGDLRRALLDTALRLIAEEGSSSFTLREVARRAGVSHAAPYRHFANKTALLAAVAEEGFRTLRTRLLEAGTRLPAEPLARLQTLGVEYVRFAVEHPSHFRVMFGPDIIDPTASPPVHKVSPGTFSLRIEAIAVVCQGRIVRGELLGLLAATGRRLAPTGVVY
jgi:AcrR family transcriptional regulator